MTPQDFTARFIDPWLNKLAISPDLVLPFFACVIGYYAPPQDNRGGGWGARFWFGRVKDESLFYNGIFTFRIMLPFYIGWSIRWSGKNPDKREFFQTYIGWKLNGFLSAAFRFQSDNNAAAGFTSPNYGQATGWQDGPK